MHATIRLAVASTIVLALTTQAHVQGPDKTTAYIDPRIRDVHSASFSTIVTGTRAAEAVERVGGTVTADLWLVDAVSAIIPTKSVAQLAASPAVRSIVLNNTVQTADEGDAIGARQLEGLVTLQEKMLVQGTAMPNGGFVSVGEKGRVSLWGQDGTIVREIDLPDDTYKLSPLVTPAGMIVVASETKDVYAFNQRGDALWRIVLGGDGKLLSSLVAGANDMLFVVDEKVRLHAIVGATGQVRWTSRATTDGVVVAAPALGADGTIYYGTDKGMVFATSPTGTKRWAANIGVKAELTPKLGPNNTLYVTSTDGEQIVALDAMTGARRWTYSINKVLANPAVGRDGTLYFGTDDGYVGAVAPNGVQRWKVRPTGGHFKTSPALSHDQRLMYVAETDQQLYAYDTATGMRRWSYEITGDIYGAPVVDADDGVIIGSDTNDLVRLDTDGRATFKVKASGKVLQGGTTNSVGDTMIRLDESKVMTIGRLPATWDGRPDVQATSNAKVWDVVSPTTVDSGAHTVHMSNVAGKPVRGTGVTVAVVDSGVYFDPSIRSAQGTLLTPLFKGQADFVEPRCTEVDVSNLGTCFTKFDASVDPYGHGTAVSSIMWNNFTDSNTGAALGVAPGANLLSVRVLDEHGVGTYETVIKGIQYVVQNKTLHNIRVMNLSLSADADVPYFVDPINRAVERAWASGIVVVTAAGNRGSNAETIGAPGNDPYVITVGALNTNRTPGHWDDDVIPDWSATGPTGDGFVKPDLLASGTNVVTVMHRNPSKPALSQRIVQMHPDASLTTSMFRMSGTSMSAPIVSGIVALMIQADPTLTPNEVKYRLLATARPSVSPDGVSLTYNSFQQGAGRVWAPDAVLSPLSGAENAAMDIATDLAAGYETDAEVAKHYQGPAQKILSDDGRVWLYYVEGGDQPDTWLGFADVDSLAWLDRNEVELSGTTWSEGQMTWGANMRWEGGLSTATGRMSWGTGRMSWGTGRMSWGTGRMSWGTGRMSWGTSVSLDEPVAPTSWFVGAR